MKPHMIFEIILLSLLALCAVTAYACCVMAGRYYKERRGKERDDS